MTAYDSLLDAVGGTPLVRLRRIAAGLAATVYVAGRWPGEDHDRRAPQVATTAKCRKGVARTHHDQLGIVSALMMFAHNEATFYVLRVLLGITEAGLFPRRDPLPHVLALHR